MFVSEWNDSDASEVGSRVRVHEPFDDRISSITGAASPDGNAVEALGTRNGRKDSPRNAKDLESPIA